MMTDTISGYTGRLLRVDLNRREWAVEAIPGTVMQAYLGGRGFTAKYCYDEISPGTDPVGPGNRLIFALGPLTGTRMPSSGRFAVGCRSPHTGAIIRSICGGGWGAMIRVIDESTDHRPGMTVAGLLHAQGMDPAIVAVWMDDDLIARDRYDRTLIPDGADVQILLLASGG